MSLQLYYKRRHEIDTSKWDRCIDNAGNGLIYAYSFYLDGTADHWDALVLEDYQAIMPLPWRKKFGFYYLYQPSFAAQLGLFGNNISADLLEKFFNAIPSFFKLWEFSLNHKNLCQLKAYNLFERKNYVLELDQCYETLFKNYNENTKRNIKKSQHACYVKTDIAIDAIIALAKKQPNAPSAREFEKFETLYSLLEKSTMAKTYGVFSATNELLASCVFTFTHDRAYYILVGNHPNGRKVGASHALIDAFIKDHAGQNLKLDFEGSDIPSLALFYSGFDAKPENYSAIRRNALPWYIKWIKN